MGRGDYTLGKNRQTFSNEGVREEQMHIDHRMVLAELQGEGSQRNGAYQPQRRFWPIKPHTVCPLTEVEEEFATLKGGGV